MISLSSKTHRYRGGPHFDQLSTFCFDLEGIALELTLPASDANWQNPPRPLNFPFNTPGWFESQCKGEAFDAAVHLHTEVWYYYPARFTRILNLLAMGTNEAVGILSIGANLKKLKNNKRLDLSNFQSLGDYIKWDYEDYYETPDVGEYGRGWNYEVRTKYKQILTQQGEWYREQYNTALASDLLPTPKRFDPLDINGGRWTTFRLDKGWPRSTQYYCLPLSDSFYLEVHIQRAFQVTEKNRAILDPDMLSAAEWLVQHIKISFPGGPLALPR